MAHMELSSTEADLLSAGEAAKEAASCWLAAGGSQPGWGEFYQLLLTLAKQLRLTLRLVNIS